MEMYLVFVGLLLLLLNGSCINARPQELETSVLMAVAQMKQLVESGAAAQNEHSVEVLGHKFNGMTAIGFGDAMPSLPGRRRRRQSPSDGQQINA